MCYLILTIPKCKNLIAPQSNMESLKNFPSFFFFLLFLFQAFPHSVLQTLPKRPALEKSSWASALFTPNLLHYQQALANAHLQQPAAGFYPTGEPHKQDIATTFHWSGVFRLTVFWEFLIALNCKQWQRSQVSIEDSQS